MDEFKPGDGPKSFDPNDRSRYGRKSTGNNEPQIDFAALDLDEDDSRPSPLSRVWAESDDNRDEQQDDERVRRSSKGNSVHQTIKKTVSRQHLMMGLGILVLLLLIFGIGSALNVPSDRKSAANKSSAERNIDLSGAVNGNDIANQANGVQPVPGASSTVNSAAGSASRAISVPPVAATPTESQVLPTSGNQHSVEVQGDLNSTLTQQQEPFDQTVESSTLPTEPATVSAIREGNSSNGCHNTSVITHSEKQPVRQPALERQHAVIAHAHHKTEGSRSKTQVPVRTGEKKATVNKASVSTPSVSVNTTVPKSALTGNVNALKSASGSHYTLQLSSSSNYNNLNAWAKKENLKNAVVYKTMRNGQPWYVLVQGIYATKGEARRAVSSLPPDVQAKNPWTKPIHQVQADLKQ